MWRLKPWMRMNSPARDLEIQPWADLWRLRIKDFLEMKPLSTTGGI